MMNTTDGSVLQTFGSVGVTINQDPPIPEAIIPSTKRGKATAPHHPLWLGGQYSPSANCEPTKSPVAGLLGTIVVKV